MACGFVVVFFWGYFWPTPAFIQTENCSRTLTSSEWNMNTHAWAFTHVNFSLVVFLASPSNLFLPDSGRFLWPFTSSTNTCFLLPVIASLRRKFAINVRKCGFGDCKTPSLAGKREIIQLQPKWSNTPASVLGLCCSWSVNEGSGGLKAFYKFNSKFTE